MHFGRKNFENVYTMDLGENLAPHKIGKTLVERDLGITISSVAQLRNSFTYFDAEFVRLLCLYYQATFEVYNTGMEFQSEKRQ